MLGRLARWLRTLGYDTAYHDAIADADLVRRSLLEDRIVVTRDRRIPSEWRIDNCLVLRAQGSMEQLAEVVAALGLSRPRRLFTRCRQCNAPLRTVEPTDIADRVPPRVLERHHEFTECPACRRVYWHGTHAERMRAVLEQVFAEVHPRSETENSDPSEATATGGKTMTTVSEIMTSDVSTLDADMTLQDAVEALRGWNVAGAPVVQEGRVVGVLSMTDVLEFEATTDPVPSFGEERPGPSEALGEPEGTAGGGAAPAYFVDFWPPADEGAPEETGFVDGPEWRHLQDRTVAEAMSRVLVSVSPDADVRRAARVMMESSVTRILVLDGKELTGMLSASDVVRAVADGLIEPR